MKAMVPIRKVEMFQSDDGRRIEKLSNEFFMPSEVDKDFEENTESIIFVGIASIMGPTGPQEIKFPIEASNVEEAFKNYMEELNIIIQQLEKTIVEASEGDLQMLDNPSPGNIII